MNKYKVALYQKIYGLNDEGIVGIGFLVNTEMTAKQLKTYYKSKDTKICDVEVELLK